MLNRNLHVSDAATAVVLSKDCPICQTKPKKNFYIEITIDRTYVCARIIQALYYTDLKKWSDVKILHQTTWHMTFRMQNFH